MNEQDLRRVLTDIAKQEIPDTMDIWNDIQSQLDKPKTKRKGIPRRRYIGAWIAIVIGMAVAISVAANTTTQPRIYASGDAGIIAVNQADLVTPLNLWQPVGDTDAKVLVPWVYADGHRISIEYHVDYPTSLMMPNQVTATLKDDTGREFPYATFLRGGGGGGGGSGERASFGSTLSFDSTSITEQPENLDLILELAFAHYPTASGGIGGGGNGGGGGGGDGIDIATPVPVIPPTLVEPFKVEFRFSTPFIPARKIEGEQSVMAGEVTMTLRAVSYAPSVIISELCFTLPANNPDWMPSDNMSVSLLIEPVFDFIPHEQQPDPTQHCGTLILMGLQPASDNRIMFVIDRLIQLPLITPEKIAQFRASLEEAGFTFEIFDDPPGTFGYAILSAPPELGSDYNTVVNQFYDAAFLDGIDGPWAFTIDLTP